MKRKDNIDVESLGDSLMAKRTRKKILQYVVSAALCIAITLLTLYLLKSYQTQQERKRAIERRSIEHVMEQLHEKPEPKGLQ